MIKNTIAIEQIKRPYATPEIMVVEMQEPLLQDVSVGREDGKEESEEGWDDDYDK